MPIQTTAKIKIKKTSLIQFHCKDIRQLLTKTDTGTKTGI